MEELKDKVVLIVDDDSRNIFALSSYLEMQDMQVLIAENGEEAIAMLKGGTKPDVILLDMMMPVMDGYETLAALKQDAHMQLTPVIAVTAKAMTGDRERCIEAGAWDYVSKPIDLHGLMSKITKLVK